MGLQTIKVQGYSKNYGSADNRGATQKSEIKNYCTL